MGTLSNTCRWEMVTDPKLGCQKWVPDQNLAVRCGHLTETRRWDMVSDHWSPDQWTGYHLSPSCISQVTIFHRQVLVRYPFLTAKFWSGTHFWQPSFGSVTISHRHILDRVPIFHRRLLREYWKKAKIEAKEKIFEAWDHAHRFSGHFLRHICQDSSYWHHPFNYQLINNGSMSSKKGPN